MGFCMMGLLFFVCGVFRDWFLQEGAPFSRKVLFLVLYSLTFLFRYSLYISLPLFIFSSSSSSLFLFFYCLPYSFTLCDFILSLSLLSLPVYFYSSLLFLNLLVSSLHLLFNIFNTFSLSVTLVPTPLPSLYRVRSILLKYGLPATVYRRHAVN
jgi:hypothetical protein